MPLRSLINNVTSIGSYLICRTVIVNDYLLGLEYVLNIGTVDTESHLRPFVRLNRDDDREHIVVRI